MITENILPDSVGARSKGCHVSEANSNEQHQVQPATSLGQDEETT
jgi:hypothetical protein